MTDLMNQSQHIQKVLENFNSDQIASNRLRLKASIDVVKVLAFQGLAFRGRDESSDSINRGNFLEILDLVVSYNEYVAEAIEKAPKNASYKSPKIQKEILHVFSNKVKKAIREEIGDAKFCLIVDEARDESMKEQMAIVIRFVDKDGFVRERFFGVVHVPDTTALTLKDEIYSILSHHSLDIQDIRGQGYDGASNMRGEWNGLKALVSNDCPYAYFIHCFAHRLQLALVAASKEVILVQSFFNRLSSIVNVVCASRKRTEQLKKAYADQIAYFVEIGELETERGLNQISTLQRAGDTRWGSHLRSISSLVNIFSPTCEILLKRSSRKEILLPNEKQHTHVIML
ncbi:zinc finger MYM-type protein 1-like [Quercus lobata]|uniref:zinc finger MYM-type protein 1-like n=1 Tax=Quercus lobata TaxID=97700 RepID=UPI0012444A10|nr:zinc finger MYM-type protein 1-like [Quercus lobata]